MPCLNEAETLAACIQKARLGLERAGVRGEILATRLQLAGWMISRSGISKIESGLVYVPDFRLPCFARLLGVAIEELYPTAELQRPARDQDDVIRFRQRTQ